MDELQSTAVSKVKTIWAIYLLFDADSTEGMLEWFSFVLTGRSHDISFVLVELATLILKKACLFWGDNLSVKVDIYWWIKLISS